MKRTLIAYLLLSLVSAFNAYGTTLLAKGEEHETPSIAYSIYIDAGSSGARLGIYSVETKNDGSLDIKEVVDKATIGGVGIHTLASKKGEIASYLEPLIDFAEHYLGSKAIPNTPIYVYGTGGLRNIPVLQQSEVLKVVNDYLRKRHFQKVHCRVVKGYEEGLFGWLTVNFLNGNFNTESSKSLGVIDVGGATLQLAYELSHAGGSGLEHVIKFQIHNKPYKLYVYSYPAFGQNTLLKGSSGIQKSCLAEYYEHGDLSSRSEKCEEEIGGTFKETCGDIRGCGLVDVQQPKLEGEFVGIGGMVYLSKELGVQSIGLKFLSEKAKEVCALTDEQLKEKSKGQVDDPSALCFRLHYLKSILFGEGVQNYNGFGFSKEEEVRVPWEINGHKSFTWTIGAVYFNTVIKNFRRVQKTDL